MYVRFFCIYSVYIYIYTVYIYIWDTPGNQTPVKGSYKLLIKKNNLFIVLYRVVDNKICIFPCIIIN